VALQAGKDFATQAGCDDQSAKCLRALSVQQVLDYQGPILKYVTDFPIVDGTVITRPAFEAFSKGEFNRVPILTGLVRDEQGFFLPEANTHKPLTAEDYNRYAASYGADHAATLLSQYPLASYDSPTFADIAMAQGAKSCTARQLDQQWSKYVPVYAYEFDDRTAPSYFPALSYPMRAYHTAELQYLFPLFRGGQGTAHPLNDAQQALSDTMVDYWTNFARYGHPNRPGRDPHPQWPRYSAADEILSLDLPAVKPEGGYGKANDCDLWDKVLSFQ
jgi:para-nitrobenzyl esterase